MLNLGPGQTRYGKPGGCDVTNQTTGSGMQQLRHQLRDWPNELLSQQLAGSHSLGCIVQTHGINVWRPGCALSYPAGRSGGATCPTTACTVSFGWLASDHANPTAPVASILPPPAQPPGPPNLTQHPRHFRIALRAAFWARCQTGCRAEAAACTGRGRAPCVCHVFQAGSSTSRRQTRLCCPATRRWRAGAGRADPGLSSSPPRRPPRRWRRRGRSRDRAGHTLQTWCRSAS